MLRIRTTHEKKTVINVPGLQQFQNTDRTSPLSIFLEALSLSSGQAPRHDIDGPAPGSLPTPRIPPPCHASPDPHSDRIHFSGAALRPG